MLRSLIIAALLVLLVPVYCAAAGRDPNTPSMTPIIKAVDPDPAKAGAEATASGTNLDSAQVASVYLSQGDLMIKVKLISETDNEIRFSLPETVKAGRYGLTILTTGKEPRYIDEPVFLSVE